MKEQIGIVPQLFIFEGETTTKANEDEIVGAS